MRIIIFLSFFILIFSLNFNIFFAQCTFLIPNTATVIDSNNTTAGGIEKMFWVCNGDSLNTSGIRNTYFVESGRVVYLSGIDQNIYVKSGGVVFGGGIDDTIYYEIGSICTATGINHVEILCTSLIFNYSNAPSNGCLSLANTDEIANLKKIEIHPNPNNGVFTIQAISEGHYILMNELGQTIKLFDLNMTNKYTVNIENLITGVYFLVGEHKNEMIRQKIVVTK